MKKLLTTTAVTAALIFGATAASAFEIGGVRFGNPFDSSTWWDGSEHGVGETVVINFADPEFWMQIPNPETHSSLHGAFTNPETWGQMLKMETYANMMDKDVWMKWTDLENFKTLRDPQTIAYFLQPGAYQHLVNKEHYAQLLNKEAYVSVADDALSNFGLELGDVTAMLSQVNPFGSDDIMTVQPAPVTPVEN